MGRWDRSNLKAFLNVTFRPRELLAQKDAELAELRGHCTKVSAEKDAEFAQMREHWSEALRVSQEGMAEKDAHLAALTEHWTRVLAAKDAELAQTREQWGEALRLSQEASSQKDAHLAALADHWTKVLAEKDAELAQTREQWGEALRLSQETVAQKDAKLAALTGLRTKEPAEREAELEPQQHPYAVPSPSQKALPRTQTALEQGPTLIFLHLPKAAGTSFKAALLEMLPPESVMSDHPSGVPPDRIVRAVMAMDPKQRGQLRAILAHVPYGLHTLFSEARYVTILREPVARILSNYYYAKGRTDFDFGKKIAAGMTIEEFASDVYSDNAQVRRLLKYSDISREDLYSAPPAGQLTRAHLDDAKDTLRRCAVVGVAERYDEFLDCVSTEFGLPTMSCRDDNITAIPWHREQVPEQIIERLREMNQFDVELYEYAAKLAAEQAAKRATKSAATRHMRPLYERASAREALELENRHAKSELLRRETELSQQQAELSRLNAELLQLRAESLRQQEESARQQAKLTGTIEALQLQLNRRYSSKS